MPAAYYNEHDKHAADWLERLIEARLIAWGVVDRRSIVDVRASDLKGFTQYHFFAGIGVWSSALREAGWPDDRPIWTGSCPCQPFSGAGKRQGTSDERHLWPHFYRLIEQCRPATIVGEQVASKDALAWLDIVFDDLERAGYATGAADICAAGAGVDFRETVEGAATLEWIERALVDCPDQGLADQLRDLARCLGAGNVSYGPAHIRQRLYWMGHAGGAASERNTGTILGTQAREHGARIAVDGRGAERLADAGDHARPMADADGGFASDRDLQRSGQHGLQPQDGRAGARSGDADGMGHAASGGCRERGGSMVAREGGHTDGADESLHGSDWIVCTDGKARPTQPGILPLAHAWSGSSRVSVLRAAGNAINKACAVAFIRAIMPDANQMQTLRPHIVTQSQD